MSDLIIKNENTIYISPDINVVLPHGILIGMHQIANGEKVTNYYQVGDIEIVQLVKGKEDE